MRTLRSTGATVAAAARAGLDAGFDATDFGAAGFGAAVFGAAGFEAALAAGSVVGSLDSAGFATLRGGVGRGLGAGSTGVGAAASTGAEAGVCGVSGADAGAAATVSGVSFVTEVAVLAGVTSAGFA
ncbi:hypothetical protein [Salipiger sp. PrR007]|uniref:hypothetical protein n=1 Tax=Salipiger sp. PrR007 TaxID=2706884 RepID=UPI0013B909DA|nr:hypothetical protein [Salipiger sp. PrR007]NDW32254.1 hypothetical protein [Salipiger sp. PrR007]